MSYPKQELYQFSIVASHPDIEATIGPQVSAIDADTKTRKIGAAVFWPIEEGIGDERMIRVIKDFQLELKNAIQTQASNTTIVQGSLRVFPDPSVYKKKQYGFYGWVEVF